MDIKGGGVERYDITDNLLSAWRVGLMVCSLRMRITRYRTRDMSRSAHQWALDDPRLRGLVKVS